MKVVVVGAKGAVGRACVNELARRNIEAIELGRTGEIPMHGEAIILAAPISICNSNSLIVDCAGNLERTELSLPGVVETDAKRKRVPNCMASLIAQALIQLHNQSTITSIIATCMQSVSGAGWRGVKALRHENTEELFHGKLINNVLPHEKAELEEHAIQKDLHALFGCNVTATSFRVPVFVGHIASVRVEAKTTIDSNILPCSKQFDPRTMEDKREVSLGRVRVHQNTADLVVCGDQLLCGTAIPAVDSIVGT